MHVAAVAPDRDTEPVRSFGTFTGDLQRLADWLERCGVRTVGWSPPASTGFQPLRFSISGFDVVPVNARDAKHVPGRKTDVSDAQWLRQLHEYDLPVPPRTSSTLQPSQHLRDPRVAIGQLGLVAPGQLSAKGRVGDIARIPAPTRAAAGKAS